MIRNKSTVFAWLKSNLGRNCLAPLTDHDWRAMLAVASIADAWGGADGENRKWLAQAYGATVRTLQPSVQRLAYHVPAHFLDWGHRAQIWHEAGLPPMAVPRCKYEPQPPPAAQNTEVSHAPKNQG